MSRFLLRLRLAATREQRRRARGRRVAARTLEELARKAQNFDAMVAFAAGKPTVLRSGRCILCNRPGVLMKKFSTIQRIEEIEAGPCLRCRQMTVLLGAP